MTRSSAVIVDPLLWVRILEQREGAVATTRGEHFSVLRQEVAAPQCALRDLLFPSSVTLRRMVRTQIVNYHVGFQRGDSELVHSDVFAVELQMAYTIPDIGIPPQRHGAQIKQLDVAIVVACTDTSLGIVVRVAERDAPAVCGCLALDGFQGNHWVLHPSVPDAHSAIAAASDQLRSSIADTQAPTTIDRVDDLIVAFDAPDRFSQVLQVPNLNVANVVSRGQVPVLDCRSTECAALEALRFFNLC
mmetsp:Transcript_10123/g.31524  ORF Transcript_10123/g.31524 Transcript_10123/m.31524 type:complete len:246 (+) Transcript_10123:186-923(+)